MLKDHIRDDDIESAIFERQYTTDDPRYARPNVRVHGRRPLLVGTRERVSADNIEAILKTESHELTAPAAKIQDLT